MSEAILTALIAKLEAENDTLRERVRQLEDQAGNVGPLIPLEWGLTGKETALIGAMVAREIASKDYIIEFIYGALTDEPPEPKIVDVFVCKARKKLEPFGIKINTIWGRGYSLDPEIRALFGKKATGAEHVVAA